MANIRLDEKPNQKTVWTQDLEFESRINLPQAKKGLNLSALLSKKYTLAPLATNLFDKVALRAIGALLIGGGISHWLIIAGILQERSPLLVDCYFHSLAILSPLAGLLLISLKKLGARLAAFICVSQIPFHLYMIYLDTYHNYQSGFSPAGRIVDIAAGLIVVAYYFGYLRPRQNSASSRA